MFQTAGQQQAEATIFFIFLVIALIILYVYYGWVRPIQNLKDKSKPKTPSVLTLIIAIIPLIFIAWAVVDEIKRMTGIKPEVNAAATPVGPAPPIEGSAEALKFAGVAPPNTVMGNPAPPAGAKIV
jgi:hypothetical protein